MPFIMRLHCFAHEPHKPFRDAYLASYDVDGRDGLGDFKICTQPKDALQFRSTQEAMALWRSVSKVRPLRPDGEPNRPLTAFTVEILRID